MPSWSYFYQGIIVPVSILIPVGFALYRYRLLNDAQKCIFLYCIVAGITNGIAALFAFHHFTNLPLLHIYTVIELVLLVRFFRYAIHDPVFRKWLIIGSAGFVVFCIVNFSFFQSIYTFNTYPRTIEAIMLIVCCMAWFRQQTAGEGIPHWAQLPETWIVNGLLLYFAGALFQFAFSNMVGTGAHFTLIMVMWDIHATLVLIMYLLFARGFYNATYK